MWNMIRGETHFSLEAKKKMYTSSMWKTRQENPPAGSSGTNAPFCTRVLDRLSLQETPQGSVDGAEMLSFIGKLSSVLGCNTDARSRWRERQGDTKWLCNERIEFVG